MSLLSLVESKLPAGFRFHPRDDELICDYLAPKLGIENHKLGLLSEALIDINLNICEPWDLPETARVGGKDWYFFNQRDRKYATGQRTNRATVMGYWKATGKDRRVTRKGFSVGMRKTLVFYRGRAPKGKKTEWVMHEYRVESKDDFSHLTCKEDWVLCRIFCKQKGNFNSMPKMNTGYDNDLSALLPPLIDRHVVASAVVTNFGFGFEQVPCFSSFNKHGPTSVGALNWTPPVLPEMERFQDPIMCDQNVSEVGLASSWNPFS